MAQAHPGFGSREAVVLWALLALTYTAGASAEDELKSQGLLRSGAFYVLGTESVVHTKLYEASAQFEPLAAALAQQAAIVEAGMQLKELDLQRIELRRRIDNINVQLGQFPIPRHRNSVHRAAVNQLQTERDGYQLTLNEINSQIGVLNNQAATPKQKKEIQAEVERRRGPFLEAIRDVRGLVDEAKDHYRELAENADIKVALEMQRRTTRANVKLGPSDEFRSDAALLQKYEKLVQPRSMTRTGTSKSKAKETRKVGR